MSPQTRGSNDARCAILFVDAMRGVRHSVYCGSDILRNGLYTQKNMIGSFTSQLAAIFAQAMLPLILLAGAGALVDRWLRLDLRSMTRLNLYILSPALLFTSLMNVSVPLSDGIRVLAFVMLVYSFMAAFGLLYARIRRLDRVTASSMVLSVTLFNAVNLGFPFVLFAYGDEGLRLAAVMVAASSFLHNGFGLFVAAQGAMTLRQSLMSLLRIPVVHAIVLALLFRLIDFTVPIALFQPIDLLGKAAIPVLLVTIGMELGRIRLGTQQPDVWAAVGIRLLIGPLIAWGAASLVGLTGLLRTVVILQASMPAAIMPIIFAREFGGNVSFVSRVVLFSTLLSIFTLSVVMSLIGYKAG